MSVASSDPRSCRRAVGEHSGIYRTDSAVACAFGTLEGGGGAPSRGDITASAQAAEDQSRTRCTSDLSPDKGSKIATVNGVAIPPYSCSQSCSSSSKARPSCTWVADADNHNLQQVKEDSTHPRTLDPSAEPGVFESPAELYTRRKQISGGSTLLRPGSRAFAAAPTPSDTILPPARANSRLWRTQTRLAVRASDMNRLLGAELGASLGGASVLALLIIAVVYIRRRRRAAAAARFPVRQEPFVVNPTWVETPTSPTGGGPSLLSLPERARPRPIPVVVHQISMPELSHSAGSGGSTGSFGARFSPTRSRKVGRPRGNTVGSESGNEQDYGHGYGYTGGWGYGDLGRDGGSQSVKRTRSDVGAHTQSHYTPHSRSQSVSHEHLPAVSGAVAEPLPALRPLRPRGASESTISRPRVDVLQARAGATRASPTPRTPTASSSALREDASAGTGTFGRSHGDNSLWPG
ncbi:hypothetical protein MKEN_01343900 [Mycena kentingensis (nom. inval.)]|nr:hypothetical protein MKEN_01343900 [Mycena kentingensis (nom. inval.)]